MTIKANDLPPEQGDGNNATIVALADAGSRRRTRSREAVRQHPMVQKAALKASLQRALKLVDEDRLDEADIELGAYARIRREP